jgi:GntR family transcriptional regulator/MocR family aminotransferase
MPRTRTSSSVELLLTLDRATARAAPPAARAGAARRRPQRAARGGHRAAVDARARSQLDVSRGIVVEAYEQLSAEGYLATRPGGVTTVASGVRATPSRAAPADLHHFEFDFRPGRPDLDLFPRDAWLRSIRRALDVMPSSRLGYLDGRGMPELRNALADYLNRVRGTVARPRHHRLRGLRPGAEARRGCAARHGARRIGIEDPTQPETGTDLRALGLDVIELPVDDAGLQVDQLDRSRVDAVVVTAAHQYPTGGVLPAERRTALLSWAKRRPGIVIEDDYDAEYRYDRDPVGALQGLAPDRVVYAGSASKILAPGSGSAGSSCRRCMRMRSRPRSARPTPARPRSTSSRSPTSWPAVSSIVIFGGCDRSIERVATVCSTRSGVTCPSSSRWARRPGYTS